MIREGVVSVDEFVMKFWGFNVFGGGVHFGEISKDIISTPMYIKNN